MVLIRDILEAVSGGRGQGLGATCQNELAQMVLRTHW